ncbi:MAG: hypothetical protein JOS17DRAFT_256780 [Linnemannia elongata]|nr:MAG: hypothetical protein JOS17DRAFT_256780 [Linnemannia elongata]
MTRAILLVKIIAAVVAMATSTCVLSGVQGAPAPTPSIPATAADAAAIMADTACVCRYADGWDRVAHCGDCNTQEIMSGSCWTRQAQGTICA